MSFPNYPRAIKGVHVRGQGNTLPVCRRKKWTFGSQHNRMTLVQKQFHEKYIQIPHPEKELAYFLISVSNSVTLN